MQSTCLDIASIARYLHRLAPLEETVRIEQHVDRCRPCRDKLLRMKRHSDRLFDELDPSALPSTRGCPSALQLHRWTRGTLPERQMVCVQEHLRRCSSCRLGVGRNREGATRRPAAVAPVLLATCAPDLDLRVAPEGIRIAAGTALVDADILPTLLQRLGLTGLAMRTSPVTAARQVHFRQAVPGGGLDGRIALLGLDGVRLDLRWQGKAAVELEFWVRERIESRCVAAPGGRWVTRILPPGHWFVGPSAQAAPWLAVAVERELLSPRDLALCAYDLCCRGRFHSALACLGKAVALGADAGERMAHAELQRFACAFGLEDRDRDIVWRRRSPAPPRLVVGALDVAADSGGIVERVAALVLALSKNAEREGRSGARKDARIVSRRRFRADFHALLISLQAHLELAAEPEAAL